MSLEQAVFGHKATSGDFYHAVLWLGSAAFVFLGLALLALNLDIELLLIIYGLLVAPVLLFMRPDLKSPVRGVVFKKFELLMLVGIALATWIFISVLWFRSIWAILIMLLLLGVMAVILWLPSYIGKEVNPEGDERFRKIEVYSSADSFNVTFAFTALIFMIGFFQVVAMGFRQAFTILVLLFIFTKSVSLAYYNRRGDVE